MNFSHNLNTVIASKRKSLSINQKVFKYPIVFTYRIILFKTNLWSLHELVRLGTFYQSHRSSEEQIRTSKCRDLPTILGLNRKKIRLFRVKQAYQTFMKMNSKKHRYRRSNRKKKQSKQQIVLNLSNHFFFEISNSAHSIPSMIVSFEKYAHLMRNLITFRKGYEFIIKIVFYDRSLFSKHVDLNKKHKKLIESHNDMNKKYK